MNIIEKVIDVNNNYNSIQEEYMFEVLKPMEVNKIHSIGATDVDSDIRRKIMDREMNNIAVLSKYCGKDINAVYEMMHNHTWDIAKLNRRFHVEMTCVSDGICSLINASHHCNDLFTKPYQDTVLGYINDTIIPELITVFFMKDNMEYREIYVPQSVLANIFCTNKFMNTNVQLCREIEIYDN